MTRSAAFIQAESLRGKGPFFRGLARRIVWRQGRRRSADGPKKRRTDDGGKFSLAVAHLRTCFKRESMTRSAFLCFSR